MIDVDKLRSGQLLNAMRDDYEFFMNVINLFISRCKNCSQNQRKDIDNYLWLAGMMKYRKGSKVAGCYQTGKNIQKN